MASSGARLWKNHVIVRPAILYGAPTSIGRGSFLQWMYQTLSRGEPLDLFADEYRTPVFVNDVVAAVTSLVERVGQHRIYHVGGPERLSRLEIGRRLRSGMILRSCAPSPRRKRYRLPRPGCLLDTPACNGARGETHYREALKTIGVTENRVEDDGVRVSFFGARGLSRLRKKRTLSNRKGFS